MQESNVGSARKSRRSRIAVTAFHPSHQRREDSPHRRAADPPRRRRTALPGPHPPRAGRGTFMTSPTPRNPSPAATRAGGYAAALPKDPGLDDILADPTLSSTAKALITVMVKNWAWYKDHCWPSDKTLAAKVGKSVGHVQRCLHELTQAGRIGREKTDEVPNGRRIWLLWRCPGGPIGAQRDMTRARSVPTAPARDKQTVIVKGGTEPEEIQPTPQRPRWEPPVPAPVSTLAPALE